MNLYNMSAKDLAALHFSLITSPIIDITPTTVTYRVAWGVGKNTYSLKAMEIGIKDINDSVARVIDAARKLSDVDKIIFEMGTGVHL
jgi:hypothetical protein